ncbi:hypothetical protein FRC03_004593 [Tulasnella sp. 419]|nr:hypothetical protein FRC03_004593 [Tulasnella sp. 419]
MSDFVPSPTASQEELPIQPNSSSILESSTSSPTRSSPQPRPSSPKRRRLDLASEDIVEDQLINHRRNDIASSDDEMNVPGGSSSSDRKGKAPVRNVDVKGKGKAREDSSQGFHHQEAVVVSDSEDDGIVEIIKTEDSTDFGSQSQPHSQSKRAGKMKEKTPAKSPSPSTPPPSDGPTPASQYTCPICFSPPTSSILTPCGHIMCGSCLFASIKAAQQRSRGMGFGPNAAEEAKCPVCRAIIPGWDGKGAGVVGLEMKVVYTV